VVVVLAEMAAQQNLEEIFDGKTDIMLLDSHFGREVDIFCGIDHRLPDSPMAQAFQTRNQRLSS